MTIDEKEEKRREHARRDPRQMSLFLPDVPFLKDKFYGNLFETMDGQWIECGPPSKILDIKDGPKLYLGDCFNASRLYENNPLGIQVVLDVSMEDEYDIDSNITYFRVPFPDGHEIPEDKFFLCMEFLNRCWDNNKVILVNCAAGVSRSPSIVCSFIHSKGIGVKHFTPPLLSIEAVLVYVKMCRRIVNPNPKVFNSCKEHLKLFNIPQI